MLWFFRRETIHVVCRVPEKPQQRSRSDFLRRHQFSGNFRYKAANWQFCGKTKGRGKLGPAGKISVPIKDVLVYPLDKEFRNILKN